jgi:hypothetical protein
MADLPKEKKPKKLPALESTPVKFWHGEQEHEMDVVLQQKEGENKAEALFERMKEIVGVKDSELASHIIDAGAGAIEPVVQKNGQLNIVAQTLHDFGPRNAIEARLALQADALFTHGMVNLRRSSTADMLCHSEHYVNKAIKLLRLHNETVEALNRYRRGGEQKIIVQHNVVADKAVVNFPGGANTKNEGDTPCSTNYAELKPEPIAISHADNLLWPMEDVDYTAAKAQVPSRKRAKSN